ncbi:MAG TPA: dodecin family protein [Gaiellaceae bacterium]|nr:dodecin family protein [Gaiellaceae bacterium]
MAAVAPERAETLTSVAKVIEITAESPVSFEDAIRVAIAKAGQTVHGIRGAWVSQQQVKVEGGEVIGFRVDLKVTFVLD